MPHNRNTFIETDSFSRFISLTQMNPAVSQQSIPGLPRQSHPVRPDPEAVRVPGFGATPDVLHLPLQLGLPRQGSIL
jgi:hypothetical protein